MENFDRCLRLQRKMGEIHSIEESLKEEIRKKEGELRGLVNEATKASVLEDKSADRLSRAADEKAAEVDQLKLKFAETSAAIPLIDREIKDGLQIKALDEIREKYGEAYGAAARAFYHKLKEAEKIEEKLISIYQEAENMASRLNAGILTVLPYLGGEICVFVDASPGHGGGGPMRNFQAECERAGIRLD